MSILPTGAVPAVLLALVLAVPTGAARGQSTLHTGALEDGDATIETGEYVDEYVVEADVGEEIVAVLSSLDFDPYLIVISPSGEPTENDDFGSSADVSLVEVGVEENGPWTVRVTTYEAGETGTYALAVGTRPDDREGPGRVFRWQAAERLRADPRTVRNERLEEGDALRSDGSYYDGFLLEAVPGETLVVTMTSPDFDTYLTIVAPSGAETSDDDSGGDTNARVELVLDEPGEWIVVANALSVDETGDYELTVERRTPTYE